MASALLDSLSAALCGVFAGRFHVPERRVLGKGVALVGDLAPLCLQIVRDGAAEIRIGDVVRGVSRGRQIAERELVRALRTSLDALQPVAKREVDRLVIADLEVHACVLFDRAPIAPVERVGTPEV